MIDQRKIAAAVIAATLAAPSTASAFDFTLNAHRRMTAANVAQIERAVQRQVNDQVAKHWPTSRLTFSATGGLPIDLVSQSQLAAAWIAAGGPQKVASEVVGFHARGANGEPVIVVWGRDFSDTATAISHELIESSTDPNGDGREIADPVEDGPGYTLDGVPVANWILPNGNPFHR